jgi:hypothetical protein
MSTAIKYLFAGFTHAFGSSKEIYPMRKPWEIAERIQKKRRELYRVKTEETTEKISKLYS